MIKKTVAALALLVSLCGGALAQGGFPQPTSSWCADNSLPAPYWRLCGQLAIAGGVRVEVPISPKMVDTFNNATGNGLDTQGIWSAAVGTNGGAATYTQGQESLSTGTTATASIYLQSKQQYQISSPSFLLWRGAINFQVPETTTNCKIMGLVNFIPSGTPTCAAPITDGIVFEVTAATTQGNPGGGKLQAVTYASGTRQLIADLSVPVPNVSFAAIANPTPGGTQPLCPARARVRYDA